MRHNAVVARNGNRGFDFPPSVLKVKLENYIKLEVKLSKMMLDIQDHSLAEDCEMMWGTIAAEHIDIAIKALIHSGNSRTMIDALENMRKTMRAE